MISEKIRRLFVSDLDGYICEEHPPDYVKQGDGDDGVEVGPHDVVDMYDALATRCEQKESILARCHEALGEHAGSDDETLPEFIAAVRAALEAVKERYDTLHDQRHEEARESDRRARENSKLRAEITRLRGRMVAEGATPIEPEWLCPSGALHGEEFKSNAPYFHCEHGFRKAKHRRVYVIDAEVEP